MKSNILIKKTKLQTYRSKLWVVVCPSISYAVDKIEDITHAKIATEDMGSVRAYAYSYTDQRGARAFFLFLRPTSKPGEIAHEAKHLVNFVFSYFGVKLSLSNDEPEAYFLEGIVDTAHRAIDQYRKLFSKPKKEQRLIERLLNSIHNN